MKKRISIITSVGILLTIIAIFVFKNQSIVTSNKDLSKYFKGNNGCFVLLDNQKHTYTIFNDSMAKTEVSPFSTFKIPNALIGLESGIVENENSTFKWDGKKYEIPAWNEDQTLSSSIKNSVVWSFQVLATKVGQERMQFYVNQLHYGNCDISGGIDNFWLNSSLKISPKDQVEFLKRFNEFDIPFKPQNIELVKKMILIDQEGSRKLYGKTGSSNQKQGWFIGYVEDSGKEYYFATYINGSGNVDGRYAKTVTIDILKDMKILDDF